MKKFAILWDILTCAVFLTLLTLKIVGVITFSWLWIVIPMTLIVIEEVGFTLVYKRKLLLRK